MDSSVFYLREHVGARRNLLTTKQEHQWFRDVTSNNTRLLALNQTTGDHLGDDEPMEFFCVVGGTRERATCISHLDRRGRRRRPSYRSIGMTARPSNP
jgi:hypothetical protein